MQSFFHACCFSAPSFYPSRQIDLETIQVLSGAVSNSLYYLHTWPILASFKCWNSQGSSCDVKKKQKQNSCYPCTVKAANGEWCFNGYTTDYIKREVTSRVSFYIRSYLRRRKKIKIDISRTAVPTYAPLSLYRFGYTLLHMQ